MEPRPADLPAATSRRVPATRPAPVAHATGRPSGRLYHRADVLVSYDTFEVSGQRYRVVGLRNLRTARGEAPGSGWMVVLSGAVLAAFGVAASFGRHPSGPGTSTYAVLALAISGPTVVGLYGRHRARRSHQLWGEYFGETRLLYADTDEREFGRVTRALLRACEAAGRR